MGVVGSLAIARWVKNTVAMITAYKRDIRRVLRDGKTVLNNLPVENPVRFSKGRMDAGIRRMIGGRELRDTG